MQSYDLPRFPVIHADLYRLSGPAELRELGFDDLPGNAVVLLEWPDRAADFLPADRLDIAFTLAPHEGAAHRNARVTGYGAFARRAERMAAVRRFLDGCGFAAADRRRLQGDASTRVYERLLRDGRSYVFMNAPPRPDGPPVRDGRPYSAVAHLAENVVPFVAIAGALRQRGLSAPEVLHADTGEGLLILEDLGDERIVAGDPPAPIDERYRAALEALAALHRLDLPETIRVSPNVDYRIPAYDLDAFTIELELLLDWYLPKMDAAVSQPARALFHDLWREALQPAFAARRTWVLRDYHSPNLLWLGERRGIARIGILDFQDAVMGPAAYDVASLLQDARVDMPETLELALLAHYARLQREADGFDAAGFVQLYATLAAQRATKILGIFARLERRDGKPQYLRHMPRIWSYLQRSLAHPALAPLRAWYDANVPALRTL
jgi:aminoglycoside/choline kinase family phosphotransferase